MHFIVLRVYLRLHFPAHLFPPNPYPGRVMTSGTTGTGFFLFDQLCLQKLVGGTTSHHPSRLQNNGLQLLTLFRFRLLMAFGGESYFFTRPALPSAVQLILAEDLVAAPNRSLPSPYNRPVHHSNFTNMAKNYIRSLTSVLPNLNPMQSIPAQMSNVGREPR